MMTSMVVTIDDILDQLWSENKRLVNELLFANKLKIFLTKLFDKYEELVDEEDKHEFKLLQEVIDNRIQLRDNEYEEEDSHVVDRKIVCNRRSSVRSTDSIGKVGSDETDIYKTIGQEVYQSEQVMNNKFKDNASVVSVIDSRKYNNKTNRRSKRSAVLLRKQTKVKNKNNNKVKLMDQFAEEEYIKPMDECYDPSTDKYICPLCGRYLRGKHYFLRHRKLCNQRLITSDTVYCCQYPDCGKKYPLKHKLSYHQITCHTEPINDHYQCDYIGCNFRFITYKQFSEHLTVHSEDRPFVCPIIGCHKKFKENHVLNRHKLIHSEPTVQCMADGCTRMFNTRSQMKRHFAEHLSEPTIKCSVAGCGQLFHSDCELQKHKYSYHKIPYRKTPRKRIYHRCDWPGCDYYGPTLYRHKSVHTGTKKYPCIWPQCGKRFADKTKLTEHMNIHNNVKPHLCRWPGCDYRSAGHSNINKHMKQVHQTIWKNH
ncbi:zinc finger protein 675-like [Oppia nitens]|uniref:zinc finger protein 675-like n=1 Tax=Oppia nitens TaxID=1686743 RepID=UPI0023DAD0DE|nr:zinc finger protein 675-like [Oppia nitens]